MVLAHLTLLPCNKKLKFGTLTTFTDPCRRPAPRRGPRFQTLTYAQPHGFLNIKDEHGETCDTKDFSCGTSLEVVETEEVMSVKGDDAHAAVNVGARTASVWRLNSPVSGL